MSVAAGFSGACCVGAVWAGMVAVISSRIRAMVSVLVPLAIAVVPDAVESARQDVHQEPPDELVRLERHGFVAAGSLYPVVLAVGRHAGRIGGDEAAVGDRDPVGVAGQIGQHLFRPGEWPLAIDEPLGPMQRREMGHERGLAGEVGVVAEELQAAGVVCGEQHLQHQAAEQPHSTVSTFGIGRTRRDGAWPCREGSPECHQNPTHNRTPTS
jgi:hypothetical protein